MSPRRWPGRASWPACTRGEVSGQAGASDAEGDAGRVLVHGQEVHHDDPCRRQLHPDPLRQLQAVLALQPDIQQQDVTRGVPEGIQAPLRRGVSHLEVRLLIQLEGKPVANQAVVLDDGDSDHAVPPAVVSVSRPDPSRDSGAAGAPLHGNTGRQYCRLPARATRAAGQVTNGQTDPPRNATEPPRRLDTRLHPRSSTARRRAGSIDARPATSAQERFHATPLISTHREEILAAWESFARTVSPASSTMDVAALRDHADQMLTVIVADLMTAQR